MASVNNVDVKAPPNNHMTDVLALEIADAMTECGHCEAHWMLKHDPNTLMSMVSDALYSYAHCGTFEQCPKCQATHYQYEHSTTSTLTGKIWSGLRDMKHHVNDRNQPYRYFRRMSRYDPPNKALTGNRITPQDAGYAEEAK